MAKDTELYWSEIVCSLTNVIPLKTLNQSQPETFTLTGI